VSKKLMIAVGFEPTPVKTSRYTPRSEEKRILKLAP